MIHPKLELEKLHFLLQTTDKSDRELGKLVNVSHVTIWRWRKDINAMGKMPVRIYFELMNILTNTSNY